MGGFGADGGFLGQRFDQFFDLGDLVAIDIFAVDHDGAVFLGSAGRE